MKYPPKSLKIEECCLSQKCGTDQYRHPRAQCKRISEGTVQFGTLCTYLSLRAHMHLCHRVDISSLVDQEPHHFEMSVLGSQDQSGPSTLQYR